MSKAVAGGGTITSLTVPNAGTIGTNTARGLSGTTGLSHDATAFDAVGKMGLGGIDIDETNQILYVLNLNDKKVYKADLSSATPTFTALATNYTAPTCTNGTFRPWALKVVEGKLYVGGVCSAENLAGSTVKTDLNASVFVYDIATSTWAATPVLNFNLNYPRQQPYPGKQTGWYPWINQPSHTGEDINASGQRLFSFPTPILSDIEFDENGVMTVGFIDRTGLQFGAGNYGTNTANTTTTFYNVSGGDILRATKSGSTYTIESITVAENEFYSGDEFPKSGEEHYEASFGGLAIVRGYQKVVMTGLDPQSTDSGGFYWLSTSDGTKKDVYEIYKGTNNDPNGAYGKAVGLGDIEALCTPAPFEIGNRVWVDTDADGVQDANEVGFPGVQVQLKSGSTVLATTTTANSTANGGSDINDSDATLSGTDASISVLISESGVSNHTLDFGFTGAPPPCTPPTYTSAVATVTTCTNGVANNDAKVAVRGIIGMTKYTYSTTGTTGFYAATATATAIDSIVLTGLSNPATATTYTLRLWGVDTTCFTDVTVTLNPVVCPIANITGTVFKDVNGLTDNSVNGTGLGNPSGTTLYANLLNSTCTTVVSSVAVNTNGTFSFPNVIQNTDYTVQISTNQGTTGSATPATALPSGWVNTGEYNSTGTGSDGTVDGKSALISVYTSSIANVNFGIEQPPIPTGNTDVSQLNPGGTTNIIATPTLFTATDPDGTVSNIKITAFPTNATSITINSINYTSATFPVAGVIVPANTSGNPTQTILVDPIDGAVTVAILFQARDNGAMWSTTTDTVNLPFVIPTEIGDRVWLDANGDGVQDANEVGIANVQVKLKQDTTVVNTTTTDANGYYKFSDYLGTTKLATSQIVATADDARQTTNNVSITSSGLSFNDRYIGFRYTSVSIPKNSVIVSATLRFSTSTAGNISNVVIKGENVANSAAWVTGTSSDISNRFYNQGTPDSVTWTNPNTWVLNASGADQTTPNLKTIVSDVIGQSGWVTGNPITFLIRAPVNATGAAAYDVTGGGITRGAILTITYMEYAPLVSGSNFTICAPLSQTTLTSQNYSLTTLKWWYRF